MNYIHSDYSNNSVLNSEAKNKLLKLEDPLMNERNSLISDLIKTISQRPKDEVILEELSAKIDNFSKNIKHLNKILISIINNENSNVLVYNGGTFDYIINLYNEHQAWHQSAKKLIKILECNSKNSYKKNSINSVVYLNFVDKRKVINFQGLKLFKKYNVGKFLSFTFISEIEDIDNIGIFDISLLIAIHMLYNNDYNCVNFKDLFRFVTNSTSRTITDIQENLVLRSLTKLENVQIVIEDHNLKKVYKENLLYLLRDSSDTVLILKLPILFILSELYDETIHLKRAIFTCPISTSKTSFLIKEYLIYRVMLSMKSNGELYFNNIYSDLDSKTSQDHKKIRQFTYRIFEYWKSEGFVEDFSINKHDGKYISLKYKVNLDNIFAL